METLIVRIVTGFKIGWWGFKNPHAMNLSNFTMVSGLLALLMKASTERRHYMSKLAYIHPDGVENEIVTIWVGAGIGSSPTKRIDELLDENRILKEELKKLSDE